MDVKEITHTKQIEDTAVSFNQDKNMIGKEE